MGASGFLMTCIWLRTRASQSYFPTMLLPEVPPDSAYSIPDLASDIGPEDLARNFEHYSYGQSKQS